MFKLGKSSDYKNAQTLKKFEFEMVKKLAAKKPKRNVELKKTRETIQNTTKPGDNRKYPLQVCNSRYDFVFIVRNLTNFFKSLDF
jgi:hypothetical protein